MLTPEQRAALELIANDSGQAAEDRNAAARQLADDAAGEVPADDAAGEVPAELDPQ